jgi:hypothetical protein
MGVAFGFDERTVTRWWARAGVQGQAVQEHLGELPRELGQGQGAELRVKTQKGLVWMALALMVRTRLWLAGEVHEPRDRSLIRRLIERVRRGAPCALVLYGWGDLLRPGDSRDVSRSGAHGRARVSPAASHRS